MSEDKEKVKPVHLPATMIDRIRGEELAKPEWLRKTVAIRVAELVVAGEKAEKS